MLRRLLKVRIVGPLLLVAVVILGALGLTQGGESGGSSAPPLKPATSGPVDESVPARFAYLSRQRSNRCDLQARELMRRHAGDRLQGACCSPMKQDAYADQVRALRRYAPIGQIPADPYDVSVALAQQLLRYRARLALSKPQRSVYRDAMAMSREKGPCCCRCWRWNAFEGLSRYLIVRREWKAPRLSRLIEALDGCGGGSKHA